jgi:hypothetical protein
MDYLTKCSQIPQEGGSTIRNICTSDNEERKELLCFVRLKNSLNNIGKSTKTEIIKESN